MARIGEEKGKAALRGGMFFPLLAFVLFFVTVIGFFFNLSPENALSDAAEKTKKELLKNEGVFLFIKDAFQNGEIRFSGDGSEVVHRANLPQGASLTFQKSKDELTFSSYEDRLVMTSSFSDQKFGTDRSGASDLVPNSAFSDAGISEEWLLLFRAYLALTEKGAFSENVLLGFALGVMDAASPEMKVEKAETGGKEYRYDFSSEEIALALSAISEQGKNKEVQEALSSYLSLAAAIFDEEMTPEKKNECLSFLTGQGEGFDSFSKKLISSDSTGEVLITVKSGRISSVKFSFGGKSLSLRSEVTFSDDLKKDGGISALFEAAEGDEKIFSLSFSQKITENSDSALIRSWNLQIEDPKQLFLSGKDKSSGEMTFSWGKKKGDLGLRLVLGGKEIGVRGAVGEFKAGKRLSFTVKRIEIDKKNVLSSPMEVKVIPKASLSAFEDGKTELFSQGSEREEVLQVLRKSVADIFLKKE